jgi:hypothetical protein
MALPDRRVFARISLDQGGSAHPLIPRETPRWRKLYKGRAAVERDFGRLKNESALLPLRVRGIERVALHADLTILAKLSCALARARALPLAAKRAPQTAGPAVDPVRFRVDCLVALDACWLSTAH